MAANTKPFVALFTQSGRGVPPEMLQTNGGADIPDKVLLADGGENIAVGGSGHPVW